MGLLIDGEWHDQWYDTKASGGRFVRQDSAFRSWIKNEEGAEFRPESGRYHLYVSYACPWAHRTLIYRRLKELENHISISVVNPIMLDHGWTFEPYEGVIEDPVNSARYLHQVYTKAKPDYTGRVTVPILWDKEKNTIVSNESAEIIRMFNSEFNDLTGNNLDFAPSDLLDEIDAMNTKTYGAINNGVYKTGFATDQSVYEEEVTNLFNTLDELDALLQRQDFLIGDKITEADLRLLPTLLRFDPVYVGHFKCNLRRIKDYKGLSSYITRILSAHDIADTINMDHIKTHYYASHKTINPTGVVPLGPVD